LRRLDLTQAGDVHATRTVRGGIQVRESYGYVIPHLIESERTITELAKRMEVTQQAASKIVAELIHLGIVEAVPARDRRSKRIRLSQRGWRCVQRRLRTSTHIDNRLMRAVGTKTYEDTKSSLLTCLAVKLMAANTPVRVARVVVTIGHTWRDFKCLMVMSGLARCFSTNQKITKHPRATRSRNAAAGSDHRCEPPRFTPMFTHISAAAPAQSILPGVAAVDSGRYAIDKMIAAIPTIRMKRKIERKPQWPENNPPRN
jgi:DNA-binding MarR family transcriptional regulator